MGVGTPGTYTSPRETTFIIACLLGAREPARRQSRQSNSMASTLRRAPEREQGKGSRTIVIFIMNLLTGRNHWERATKKGKLCSKYCRAHCFQGLSVTSLAMATRTRTYPGFQRSCPGGCVGAPHPTNRPARGSQRLHPRANLRVCLLLRMGSRDAWLVAQATTRRQATRTTFAFRSLANEKRRPIHSSEFVGVHMGPSRDWHVTRDPDTLKTEVKIAALVQ